MTAKKEPKQKPVNNPKMVAKRFKPGQSGNPAGRPKGSICFKTLLTELLEHEVKNSSDVFWGKNKKISASRAMLVQLFKKAMLGDVTAARLIMDRAGEAITQELNVNHNISEKLSDEDEAILSQFVCARAPSQ